MKKYLLILLSILIPFFASSQINENGLPLLTNYDVDTYKAHAQSFAIEQDNRGVTYFANGHGLLQFDGTTWFTYENKNSPSTLSLDLAPDGTLYYGGIGDFGLMQPDELGQLNFVSLSQKHYNKDPDYQNVWKTHATKDKVIFQSFEKIFIYSPNTKDSSKIKVLTPESAFHLSFYVHGKLYVRQFSLGLYELVNDSLHSVNGGDFFANDDLNRIYSMLPMPNGEVLIAARSGLYTFNPDSKNSEFKPFAEASTQKIKDAVVYGGAVLPSGEYAISTLASGILVFNNKGQLTKMLNTETGIKDQSILSIATLNNNLWFSTNASGIYRANYGSPFSLINRTNGLIGVAQDVVRFNNILYAATNSGVYYLDKSSGELATMKPVKGLREESWKFETFATNDSTKKLLIGTTKGIFEIIDNQTVKKIDNNTDVYYLSSSKHNKNIINVGYYDGFGQIIFNHDNHSWTHLGKNDTLKIPVRNIAEDKEGRIWLGSGVNGTYRLDSLRQKEGILLVDSAYGLPLYGSENRVFNINDKVIFTVGKGAFLWDEKTQRAIPYDGFGSHLKGNNGFGIYTIAQDKNEYWLSSFSTIKTKSKWEGLFRYTIGQQKSILETSAFAKILTEKVPYVIYPDSNKVWVANDYGLYCFNRKIKRDYSRPYHTIITKVTMGEDSILFAGTNYLKSERGLLISNTQHEDLIPVFKFKNNFITFEYASPYFEAEQKTQYSYRLVGYSNKWSKWTYETKFPYTNLHEGDYKFQVKAKNIYDVESKIASYKFTILPPWYRTIWAYILFSIGTVLLVYTIVKLNSRRLIKEKVKLERIVEERTSEILEKNVALEQHKEEIEAQRDEITVQRDQVIHQRDEILEQKKSIMDSIHYASRIQGALLPPQELMDRILPQHFVLFRPRDVVSGDFYWATERDGKTVIVAADCTGHGVPGAFMSMLGMSFLNEIVNNQGIMDAGLILTHLRTSIKKSLRQTGTKDNESKDGMDLALCIIDFKDMKLQFSGAYNPLYLIRNNEVVNFKADRMPIGIYIKEKEFFTNNNADLQKGDQLYIFSDGFPDQFGGHKGGKLMSKRFKQILLDNHKEAPEVQRQKLDEYFDWWVAHENIRNEIFDQIDDVLIVGIKI